MKLARILMQHAPALALTACFGSNVAGVRPDPLPANVAAPCPSPASLLSRGGMVADDEISMGRIGDALISCGREKAVAVTAYNDLAAAITAR
jgi:hypothetical protein